MAKMNWHKANAWHRSARARRAPPTLVTRRTPVRGHRPCISCGFRKETILITTGQKGQPALTVHVFCSVNCAHQRGFTWVTNRRSAA